MEICTDSMSKAKGTYAPLDPWSSTSPYGDGEGRLAPPERKSRWRELATYLRVLVEITSAILLAILLWKVFSDSHQTHLGPDSRVSSGPFNQHRQFGHNDQYASFSHKQDYLWSGYAPEDSGELQLPPVNSTGYSLDQLHDYGGIAMFHSLHCLAGMLRAFQEMSEGKITMKILQNDPHVPHCFDYLRQTVLCFADDTFELARDEFGIPDGKVIEGAFDIRTCRDSTKLDKLVEKYGTKTAAAT